MLDLYVLHDLKRDMYICYEKNTSCWTPNRTQAKKFGYLDALVAAKFYPSATVERCAKADLDTIMKMS